MTKDEKELQEARTELLDYLLVVLEKFHYRLSQPEVSAIQTLYDFEILIKENLRLMYQLEQKEGEAE